MMVDSQAFGRMIKTVCWVLAGTILVTVTAGSYYIDQRLDALEKSYPTFTIDDELLWEVIEKSYRSGFTEDRYQGVMVIDSDIALTHANHEIARSNFNKALKKAGVSANVAHYLIKDIPHNTVTTEGGQPAGEGPNLNWLQSKGQRGVFDYDFIILVYPSGQTFNFTFVDGDFKTIGLNEPNTIDAPNDYDFQTFASKSFVFKNTVPIIMFFRALETEDETEEL